MVFGGNKSLFTKMKLNETVADTVLPFLDELYESDDRGAILKTDEGYVIVAISEKDMTAHFGNNPKVAEFGSFVNVLNNGSLKTSMIASDVAAGFIGIFTDRDSLMELEEYSFLVQGKVPLYVAVVPFDFSESTGIDIYDTKITIPELFDISNSNKNVRIVGDEAEVVEMLDEEGEELPSEEDIEFDEAFGLSEDEELEDISEENFEVEPESDFAIDELVDEAESFNADYLNELLADSDDELDQLIAEVSQNDNVIPEAVETQVVVNDGLEAYRKQQEELEEMRSDDLQLTSSMNEFWRHFSTEEIPVQLFDESVAEGQEGSELELMLASMRRTYNEQIRAVYERKMGAYAREYDLALHEYLTRLEEALDYRDNTTDAGRQYEALIQKAESRRDEIKETRARKITELTENYEERRQKYIDDVIKQAGDQFDSINKASFEASIRDDGSSEALIAYNSIMDEGLRDLHSGRKKTARAFVNKAVGQLLSTYDNRVNNILIPELESMIEGYANDLKNEYQAKFGEEVMRAESIRKAILRDDELALNNKLHAEALEQKDAELAEQAAKYEQLLSLEAKKTNDAIERLKQDNEASRNTLNLEMKAKEEALAAREAQLQSQLEAMRLEIETYRTQLSSLEQRKSEEYEQRLRARDDENKALLHQLNQVDVNEAKNDRMRRNMNIMMAGVGLTSGMIGTYALTSNNANNQIEQYEKQVKDRDDVIEDLRRDVNDLQLRNAIAAANQ